MKRIYDNKEFNNGQYYWLEHKETGKKNIGEYLHISKRFLFNSLGEIKLNFNNKNIFEDYFIYGPIPSYKKELTEEEILAHFQLKGSHFNSLKSFYLKKSKKSPFKVSIKELEEYNLYCIKYQEWDYLKEISKKLKPVESCYFTKTYYSLEILEYLIDNSNDKLLEVFFNNLVDDNGFVPEFFSVHKKSGKLVSSEGFGG